MWARDVGKKVVVCWWYWRLRKGLGMQKEGDDRRKKMDGSLSHIACVAESIISESQMCVIHIKLSKLKGHLTPPLPSLILSPSPSPLPLSLCCFYTHTGAYMHAHILYMHTHSLTSSSSFIFFKGTCWEGWFMLFCNSSVALGCKTHLCAASWGIVGYLIWCE